MVQIYNSPETIQFPAYQWKDPSKYEADIAFLKNELKVFCQKESKCPDAGEIIRFQIADGYAQYMIFSYTKLIHIPEDDAYQISDALARGLRKEDILGSIKNAKALKKLFEKSEC